MLAPFGRRGGLGDTVNAANITVKDYLRREGAPMFWRQIMQSGLYARVKSLEPRLLVLPFALVLRALGMSSEQAPVLPLGAPRYKRASVDRACAGAPGWQH